MTHLIILISLIHPPCISNRKYRVTNRANNLPCLAKLSWCFHYPQWSLIQFQLDAVLVSSSSLVCLFIGQQGDEGSFVSWGSSACPCVEKVQGSSLLPVRVERKITLLARNLHLYQVHTHTHIFNTCLCAWLMISSPNTCPCVFRTLSWTMSVYWSLKGRQWWWMPTWRPMTPIHQTLTSPVSCTRSEIGHYRHKYNRSTVWNSDPVNVIDDKLMLF